MIRTGRSFHITKKSTPGGSTIRVFGGSIYLHSILVRYFPPNQPFFHHITTQPDISSRSLDTFTGRTPRQPFDPSPSSQASTVPVRNTDAVGVSHSVPAFPGIPSPSGREKQSKLGLILPVATSMELNIPSASKVLKQHSFPLTFRTAKSPPTTTSFHPTYTGTPDRRTNNRYLGPLANLQFRSVGFCCIHCWFRWFRRRTQRRCC